MCCYYYMAVSHEDRELPNSWIWLAEIDIESDIDIDFESCNV